MVVVREAFGGGAEYTPHDRGVGSLSAPSTFSSVFPHARRKEARLWCDESTAPPPPPSSSSVARFSKQASSSVGSSFPSFYSSSAPGNTLPTRGRSSRSARSSRKRTLLRLPKAARVSLGSTKASVTSELPQRRQVAISERSNLNHCRLVP